MGWAARANATPGIRPSTKSYRRKLGSPVSGYAAVPTVRWDASLKRVVETGHVMLVRSHRKEVGT